ncbi:MAG: DnaJ domain-containing protein [Pseudomonadales bacterium]|nr:DnaJ domain-containing protein [Pseudomonadales bacterium]MCP5185427.1 DnaJ domain-containing protein [Pseudomonadales bacterium]
MVSPLNRLLQQMAERYAARSRHAHMRLLFTGMGRIAKSAGRVTAAHIAYAKAVMERLDCTPRDRARAIAWFNEGKEGDVDFHQMASRCLRRQSPVLDGLVLEAFAAIAALEPTPAANRTLHLLASLLGRSAAAIASDRATAQREQGELANARAVLGVAADVDEEGIRRAYRQLAKRHHPDLLPLDASREQRESAVARTIEIRGAYERLRQATAGVAAP